MLPTNIIIETLIFSSNVAWPQNIVSKVDIEYTNTKKTAPTKGGTKNFDNQISMTFKILFLICKNIYS